MAKRRDAGGWSMSWARYKELYFYCLQYRDKQAETDDMLVLRISTPKPETFRHGGRDYGVFPGHGSGRASDPVAVLAMRRERALEHVRTIDAALDAACREYPGMREPLKRVVTTGKTPRAVKDASGAPMGINQFYKLRRGFFAVLDLMLKGEWEG